MLKRKEDGGTWQAPPSSSKCVVLRIDFSEAALPVVDMIYTIMFANVDEIDN
jgi:hypothetical protein